MFSFPTELFFILSPALKPAYFRLHFGWR